MTNEVEQTTKEAPRARTYTSFLDELGSWYEEQLEAVKSGKPRGPMMPSFPRLSEALGGCLEVGAHYLIAPPDVGKSALAGQFSASCKCPALVVSTEMSMRELFLRQVARTQSKPIGELKSGTISKTEFRRLAKETAQAMPQVCILDATDCAVSLADIQRETREIKDEAGHLLLVVDSLHSLARRTDGQSSEYERITSMSSSLELLAKTEKVAVLIVAERSRGTMVNGGLSSAKGSSTVEYSANSVWTLDNTNDGNRNPDGSVDVTLKIAKNKSGPNGMTIWFKFFPQFMRFIEEA